MLPSLGKYSTLSIAEDATHSVTYDRSFKLGEGDDEEIVAPEDVGKAYKVAKHLMDHYPINDTYSEQWYFSHCIRQSNFEPRQLSLL